MKTVLAAVCCLFILLVSAFLYIKNDNANKRADAISRIDTLRSIIQQAELMSRMTVDKITNSSCSMCPCKEPGVIKNGSYTNICTYNWHSAIIFLWRTIGREGYPPNFLMTDPWGSPFLLNENKTSDTCYEYILTSAGPDREYGTSDDLTLKVRTSQCEDPKSSATPVFIPAKSPTDKQ